MSLSLFNAPFESFWQDDPFFNWPLYGARGRQQQQQGGVGGQLTRLQPKMDLFEQGDHLICQYGLPGVDKQNLDISLQNDQLVVSGHVSSERTSGDPNSTSWISERSYGSFVRATPVPAGTTENDIKAELKEGVLRVEMPKESAAQSGRKRIAIS